MFSSYGESSVSDPLIGEAETAPNEQHRLVKEVGDHESFMEETALPESSPVDREDCEVEYHGEVKGSSTWRNIVLNSN